MLKPRRLVRLFLVFVASPGAATLVDGVPDAQIGPEQAFAALGSVAGAGDVNGDGYDDVIVGASSWNVGASAHPRPRTAKS